MKNFMLIAVTLAALTTGGWVANDRMSFDRAAWLADYAQLTSAIEAGYANLPWSRSSKQADLVALDSAALEQLQAGDVEFRGAARARGLHRRLRRRTLPPRAQTGTPYRGGAGVVRPQKLDVDRFRHVG